MTPHDAHKTKTRKSLAQQFQIACCRISKTACPAQPCEEIVQIPAHQFKAEHLVACCLCVHHSAYVHGIISSWINPELRGITRFGFRQKKLLRHARSAGVAQSITQQIAARPRNRADCVTAPRMPQLVKQTSHLVYTSRLRTFSALSSMNWRRGSTMSPIRIVNILSASTALSSLRSTFNSLRFSGFMVVSNNS